MIPHRQIALAARRTTFAPSLADSGLIQPKRPHLAPPGGVEERKADRWPKELPIAQVIRLETSEKKPLLICNVAHRINNSSCRESGTNDRTEYRPETLGAPPLDRFGVNVELETGEKNGLYTLQSSKFPRVGP